MIQIYQPIIMMLDIKKHFHKWKCPLKAYRFDEYRQNLELAWHSSLYLESKPNFYNK